MINKQDIEKVLSEYPTLHYSGFGVGDGQHQFYENLAQIQVVVDMLKDVRKIKRINKTTSSYGLKHWVEHQSNYEVYIANGSFIVGAILSGFDVLVDAPNAYFNMSTRDTKYHYDFSNRVFKHLTL